MSVLELPHDTAVPTNVITVAAALPPPQPDDPKCVLPYHVAVVYKTAPQPNHPPVAVAATYLQPTYDTEHWRILGVTLDMIPFLDTGTTKPRMFSVAVAGLVPVVVPAASLKSAKVGDRLWALPNRNEYTFKPGHVGVTFVVDPPLVEPNMRLVGTIYGLGTDGANHCLVLLALGAEQDHRVFASRNR